MKHWLIKTEPSTYAWSDLVKKKRDRWDGIRNHQARNNLAAMSVGDSLVVYHSGDDKSAIGIARVVKAAYPEPGADDPRWLAVDIEPVRALARPVPLGEMKQAKALTGMALFKQSRLSVVPLTKAEHDGIVKMGAS
jgi:predicted RNA-binding protein with PUA-like domain